MAVRAKMQPALARAIGMFDSNTEFARQIGISKQRFHYWTKVLGYVPAEWVTAVSQATGNKVTVMELLNETTRQKVRERIAREERKAKAELASIEAANPASEGVA